MKTTLTIEQSKALIDLGVDPKLASEDYVDMERDGAFVAPVFTLSDIIGILPKEIEGAWTM